MSRPWNSLLNFNIEEKMTLAYLPILLVIVLIAFFSLQSLSELKEINESIIAEDNVLIQTADRMRDNILAQESYGRRYLILESQQMLLLFLQRSKEFDALIDRIRALPDYLNVPVEQLASLHSEFNALYTAGDDRTGKALQSSRFFDAQAKNRLDKIMVILQKMALTGRQNQYEKMQKANNIGIKTFRISTLLSTLGILLGLGATYLISRGISVSIKKLKGITEVISEGKFSHFPQIESKDELGELAGSLNTMAWRLAKLEEIHLDSNPLTRLPGGLAVEKVLAKRLETGDSLAFCLLDLDNFKSFNDRYGYARGNDVIKAAAHIIKSVVAEFGTEENFVGHIGGDDFAIIVQAQHYAVICKNIVKRFDEQIVNFYNAEDRARGYILGRTRQSKEIAFPIMTISIAVVTNDQKIQTNRIEMGETAAELKEYAKSIPGSVFVVNRRGGKTTHQSAKISFLHYKEGGRT